MGQTGGGDDSLLAAPRVDVAMKVYQGGGLSADGQAGETEPVKKYKGVTGMVSRHQVSLYSTPARKVQLKVYKGGGETGPTFRGEGIKVLQENKEFYKSLLATGKYYLDKVLGEEEVLKGQEEELKSALDKFGVFFYGEMTSTFTLQYKSQLLLFSTVMGTPDPEAPGTLGILLLTVDDGWTISVPSEDLGLGGTVFIGPFMMRDPDHLTVDQFFEHLEDGTDTHAKSERLYMKEIIFGGYPLSLLKKVLAERREDFFEKVWKPLLAYNVIDNITFQLSSPLKEAREFLSDLRDEQIREISRRLDTYLEGQGVERQGVEGQGVEVDDADGTKEEEDEAWEAEEEGDAEEDEAEYEEEAEEEPAPKKRTGTKLKKALGTLDTVLPEEEGNSHLDAHCESIRSFDTKGDILFEYVKSLYIVLTDTDIEKLSTDLPKLQAFVAQMKAIQIPQVPEEMKEIILVFKDYLASLDALIEKQLKSKKPKRGETPYATEFDELKSISDMLKMYICRGYLIAKSKGPAAARRGGSRKTRRLSKSSHRV